MSKVVRVLGLVLIAALMMIGVARAQTDDVRTDININDIAGDWKIEVIGRPDDDFKGTARIPKGEGYSVMAETITEDKCCGGRNHARVLQDSRITITNGFIEVESEIVKFLLREEEVDISYSADDFTLSWVDENTLVGELNGYTPVRWVRNTLEVS